jgi:hypothetical protein
VTEDEAKQTIGLLGVALATANDQIDKLSRGGYSVNVSTIKSWRMGALHADLIIAETFKFMGTSKDQGSPLRRRDDNNQ